ncbi:MAG: hypothetical protein ACFBSD_09730 [Paracoccaceae bacterium]
MRNTTMIAGLVITVVGTVGVANAAPIDYRLDFETRDPFAGETGLQSTETGRFNDPTIYPPTTSSGPVQQRRLANRIASRQFEQTFGVVLSTPDYNDADGSPGSERTNPLALFDSNCDGIAGDCAGDDDDLATGPAFNSPAEGNILIVNENNLGDTDDVVGGDVFFDFTEELFPFGANIDQLILVDFDDAEASENIIFTFTSVGGTVTTLTEADFTTIASPPEASGTVGFIPVDGDPALTLRLVNPAGTPAGADAGDNSYSIFTFGDEIGRNVRQLEVDYQGISGGIGVLAYSTGTRVPLPASALLLLGALGVLGGLRLRGTQTPA